MKRIFLAICVLLLAGCATGPQIDRSYNSLSQDSRVRFLVLHYTAVAFPGALRTLTEGAVSSHYLVDDTSARIYGLVDENRRSYHAGVSSWRGFNNLNYSSIGIEIVNLGFIDTPQGRQYVPYAPKQIDAVVDLVENIVKRHHIAPENVIGHSDIAPGRKVDPGPLFPWKRLADKGLILWPDEVMVAARQSEFNSITPDPAWFQQKLATVGYLVPQTGILDSDTIKVISAFQMKYRPANFAGVPDTETAAMLDVLTAPPPVAPKMGCARIRAEPAAANAPPCASKT